MSNSPSTDRGSLQRSKHTPGPWIIESSGWSNGSATGGTIGAVDKDHGSYRMESGKMVLEPRSVTILHYTLTGNGIAEEANLANARLIAAAPELLDALQAVLAFEEDEVNGPWPQAVAAIKKAIGA